jgi:hypothetical protein
MWQTMRYTLAIAMATGVWAACAPGGEPRSSSRSERVGAPARQAEVKLIPSRVTLDYSSGEMEIRGSLVKEPGSAYPKKVWVWSYFINPTETLKGEPLGGSRSDDPIMVDDPFTGGDTARIVAQGPFHWATNPDAPRRGYYARLSVSALSAEAAQVPVKQRDYRTQGAIRVISKP